VNVYWGVLNLLPIYPLDGGQVSRELCGKVWGSRGRRISLQISFVLALLLVAYALLCAIDTSQFGAGITEKWPWWAPRGSIFTAILFGLLAMSSYQLLQQPDFSQDDWDDRPPWER
jgi:Zn-dependent protease